MRKITKIIIASTLAFVAVFGIGNSLHLARLSSVRSARLSKTKIQEENEYKLFSMSYGKI